MPADVRNATGTEGVHRAPDRSVLVRDLDAPGDTAVDLAVDLADERPSQTVHGLRPDRTARWLVGAMVGTALAVIAVVTAVRSASDDPHEREVPLLEAQLAEPLSFAVISLERVRVEWITTEILRTLDRPLAQASKRAPKAPVHAATASPSAEPSSGVTRRPSSSSSGARKLSDLPPAPAIDTPADAPADPEPAADAPPADPPADADAPPSALPSVDAPEPDVVDDEV